MKTRVLVQVVAAVVVGVLAAGTLLAGEKVEAWWLRAYSVAVLAAMLLLFLWDRLLWKVSLAQKFRAVPRDLRGTWQGVLETFWIDPRNGVRPPPKPAYLVIRQTASAISVVLLTDESRSASTFGKVSDDGTTASLEYMYLNRPDSRVEDRSRMHHGSASFDLIGRPVTRLKGRYWTSRDSRGEMEFTSQVKDQAEGFSEAASLFAKSAR